MSFLNPIILAGLGLVAIPVILHFLLRQTPKKLLFPALRLLQERRRQSVRRLRLRHLWLLILRMLALAALVLAIARPSLPPANYSLTVWELAGILALAAAGFAAHRWYVARIKKRTPSVAMQDEAKFNSQRWTLAATLTAMLLLIGWPYQRRIAGEIRDPTPAAVNLPVAAVFLFDTSLSMSWQQAGETTLDRARKLANKHWETFPPGSRLAVAETAVDHPVTFGSTSLAAQTRLENLEISPVALPLEDRLREALQSQLTDRQRISGEQENVAEASRKDRFIRRIYVFTDLAKSAWRTAASRLLLNELAEAKSVGLYLVDLGSESQVNQAVREINLSSTRIPTGGELLVSATLTSQGSDIPQQQADLMFLSADDSAVKQGQVQVRLDSGVPARVEFPALSGMSGAWIQGEVRLPGTDPLTFDNLRRFTVESSAAPRVLVIAPNEEVALPWLVASEVRQKFKPEFRSVSQLASLNLNDYQAVTLLNVDRLADESWQQLGRFVDSGGGLIVILGSEDISSPSYNRESAQRLLPARLDSWQPKNDWRFEVDVARRNHPVFALYHSLQSQQPFALLQNLVFVERFWKVQPLESTPALMNFTDSARSPALLERAVGKGRVLLLTTGVDLVEDWTNLADPIGDPWLFLAWTEQLTGYATRFSDQPYTFISGEAAPLQLDAAQTARPFLLSRPGLKQTRHVLPAGERLLTIHDAIDPGRYTLLNADTRQVMKAFSVNAPASESDLTRMTAEELNQRLGENRYKRAQSLDELQEEIDTSDLGQEVYPALLMLLVVVFCGEMLVASRFYAEAGSNAGSDA